MAEATWGEASEPPAIDWRMSAALENVPRGDDDLAEVTSLEGAVRAWQQLDAEHQAEAVLTPERPVRLNDGEGVASFSGEAIHELAATCRTELTRMAGQECEPGEPAQAPTLAEERRFLAALEAIPASHSEGVYTGRRWGVTLTRSPDGRRRWLYGEELGGTDRVSFNLYMLGGRPALRPCEMPVEKVIAFVLGYRPDPVSVSAASRSRTTSRRAHRR